jgi:hypothetical protein
MTGTIVRDPARTALDIITGAWRSQALYAAVALRIPDHIADGHRDTTTLAAATGAQPDGIERLMRLLVAIDVFAADADGYRLTPVAELLRSDVPGSLRDMCQIYGEEFHRAWGAIVPAISTGDAGFQHAFGQTLHQYLATTDGAGVKFQRAMHAGSQFFAEVPSVYDFGNSHTVLDVGGGSGQLLAVVLAAEPHLRGVLFEVPHMTQIGEAALTSALGTDRWSVHAGDMFQYVPADADTYLLSRVLQDWDDDRCVRLLTNCAEAMSESDRLLIVERVIPDDGSELLPLLWDLHLLVMAGGRERTLAGYQAVLRAAGLRLVTVHSLELETSLLVAARADSEDV